MHVVNIVLNDFTNDSRVLKTSKTLMGLGMDVRVVALHREGLPEHDCVSGVPVDRIRLQSRNWSKHPLVQLVKFAEFAFRFLFAYKNAGVLHCNDLNALVVGCLCKLAKPKTAIVYDSHEFAINAVPGESQWSVRSKYCLERLLIRFASAVITVSNSIAEEYARMYRIRKPYLVLNCPNYVEAPKTDTLRTAFGLSRSQKVFLYQGALSRGRGIEIILEAFSRRRDSACVLVCMGYGPLESLVKEQARDSNNIFFHPAVSPGDILAYTGSADYGISFIEDLCLSYRYCLPNKLFEYLMAGVPVLVSNLVEMQGLVGTEGVGAVADGNTVSGFLKAVDRLLEMDYVTLTDRVRAARRKYCWENQEAILQQIYQKL